MPLRGRLKFVSINLMILETEILSEHIINASGIPVGSAATYTAMAEVAMVHFCPGTGLNYDLLTRLSANLVALCGLIRTT